MPVFSHPAGHEHEQVVFCYDRETGLRAIIALHDTRLGPGLGGIRLLDYPGEPEALTDVLRLSRAMSYKASVTGLDLGGGKAVILGPLADALREEAFRAMGRFVESLGGRYIATEDMGTTTADIEAMRGATDHAVGRESDLGGGGDPSPMTARGIYAGIRAALAAVGLGEDVSGRHVAIQGVGKVGLALAGLLISDGARVTVSDTREVQREAAQALGAGIADRDAIWETSCDVLAPCAAGSVINERTLPRLKCRIVAGGANNQLEKPADGEALHRRGILYAPDFVINGGGLINVADELAPGGYQRERVLQRVNRIGPTLTRIFEQARRADTPTEPVALALARRRLESA